ncbi:endolytic transglycosylase MltG [Waterburya agarophytonicola K14]|uniref:Endolytic murein transglycosylase n=1 Tax=Waterburya agarophytonicola KI4 TaxID=2874699 RepID=A0A964BQW3_9CYAN|nr:endolytic transglycosylase MltG [Waterburya agarophytonicola]MCC0176918.1 endolytic transglycosylase MltG [Waterburya agarophytonicola KI4]
MTTKRKFPRKKTSKRKTKISPAMKVIPATVGVLFLLGLVGWKGLTAPVESPGGKIDQEKQVPFTVKSGVGGNQIGAELAQAGLIKSHQGWKIWTKLKQTTDSQGGFKAGTYLLSPQESLSDIATKIWSGDIMQTNFTIPEGWSTKQMAAYFADRGYFSAEEFANAVKQIPYDKYPWLPQDLPILEGFLYPDTYKISSDRTSDPEGIIYTMLDRFEEVALPVYEAEKPDMSLNDWVTLASIVEKEAVVGSERRLIAGVFTARLEKGIKLGSDPTVEYGLGIRQTADQPLTYTQVGTPSPYNTYMNVGLTPTPIASPGIESLKATLNPEDTNYLYFVARYDGTHIFSETLRAHEAATREIRRQRNQ